MSVTHSRELDSASSKRATFSVDSRLLPSGCGGRNPAACVPRGGDPEERWSDVVERPAKHSTDDQEASSSRRGRVREAEAVRRRSQRYPHRRQRCDVLVPGSGPTGDRIVEGPQYLSHGRYRTTVEAATS
jgi:hypothetical protein